MTSPILETTRDRIAHATLDAVDRSALTRGQVAAELGMAPHVLERKLTGRASWGIDEVLGLCRIISTEPIALMTEAGLAPVDTVAIGPAGRADLSLV